MNSVPRWLLVGMMLMTFGVQLTVEAWNQQALRRQIYLLEQDHDQALEDHLAARARYQCDVLAARPVLTLPLGDVEVAESADAALHLREAGLTPWGGGR
ncbi:MAG: hypothetical protein AB7O52_13980 [Planctomycetota bacterium]